MVFQDFLDFLVFLETSEVAGPGPNPREIDISFGADGPLACARPDPTIGWTDVLPCVFVCVWGRYPPAAALLVRRLVVPVLNKLLQLPPHPLARAWRVLCGCLRELFHANSIRRVPYRTDSMPPALYRHSLQLAAALSRHACSSAAPCDRGRSARSPRALLGPQAGAAKASRR